MSELSQECVSQTRGPVGQRRLEIRLSDAYLCGCDVLVRRIRRWEQTIFVRIPSSAEDVSPLNLMQWHDVKLGSLQGLPKKL